MSILRLFIPLVLVVPLWMTTTTSTRGFADSGSTPAPLAIQVDQAGIYRLTSHYLSTHGFDVSHARVKRLGLADSGQSVPIYIHHSRGLVLAAKDYIEFYAHPVFNSYTRTNTYVLTANGEHVSRVHQESAKQAVNPAMVAPNTYTDNQRSFFDPVQDNAPPYSVSTEWPSAGDAHWKEADLILASTQPQASDSIPFRLANPSSNGACTITVPTFGYADQTGTGTPSFEMDLGIGGSTVVDSAGASSFTWQASGRAGDLTADGTFPCLALGSGGGLTKQQLMVSSTLQPQVQLEEVAPQYFSITYPERLCAINNQLSWNGSGASSYGISGFSSRDLSVWKVSGDDITRFKDVSPTGFSNNPCANKNKFSVSFADPSTTPATYYATSQPRLPAAAGHIDLKSITARTLKPVSYLIITTSQFAPALQPLARYHDKHGLSTRVVTTKAIYDQYQRLKGRFLLSSSATVHAGDAQLNPEAIRAFIDFAVKHWRTRYVLIAGGDTFDPLNFYQCPQSGLCASANPDNLSIVPTLYENSVYDGPTQADNLYVVPEGQATTAPDAAIGRLPAVTLSQLTTEVHRSIMWSSWVHPYEKTATFVAGFASAQNYGGSCGDPEFGEDSDQMASRLPSDWVVNKAYEDGVQSNDIANRSHLLSLFDKGQEIVNYIGHGNLQQWSCLPEFSSDDISHLTNVKRLAAVFQWGCQATDFVNPRLPNMDSLLLDATRKGQATGAVIAVGSSGLDLAEPQAELAGGTVNQSSSEPGIYGYVRRGQTMGQALRHAKDDMVNNHVSDPNYVDVVNSYTILGDPALKLPL